MYIQVCCHYNIRGWECVYMCLCPLNMHPGYRLLYYFSHSVSGYLKPLFCVSAFFLLVKVMFCNFHNDSIVKMVWLLFGYFIYYWKCFFFFQSKPSGIWEESSCSSSCYGSPGIILKVRLICLDISRWNDNFTCLRQEDWENLIGHFSWYDKCVTEAVLIKHIENVKNQQNTV
jgi:hypothetical protein